MIINAWVGVCLEVCFAICCIASTGFVVGAFGLFVKELWKQVK